MARFLLYGWVVVILGVAVPWTTFQSHSHWNNVAWIPFANRYDRLRDIAANVIFYFPFGYFARRRRPPIRPWKVGLFAFGLSVATEFTQVFSHGRFPSATDVVSNTIGALAGAALADRPWRVLMPYAREIEEAARIRSVRRLR